MQINEPEFRSLYNEEREDEGGSDQNLTKIFTEFKKNYLGKTRIKIHHWISNPTVQ